MAKPKLPKVSPEPCRHIPARLGEHRIAVVASEVERAAVHDQAADGVAVAAEKLRGRMYDDIGAVLEGADQVGRRHGVVDDERMRCFFAIAAIA